MSKEDNKIMKGVTEILKECRQISILFDNYQKIYINKGSDMNTFNYSFDRKSWTFNISEKHLIEIFKKIEVV